MNAQAQSPSQKWTGYKKIWTYENANEGKKNNQYILYIYTLQKIINYGKHNSEYDSAHNANNQWTAFPPRVIPRKGNLSF